jgi:hypothetical protein
MGTSPNLAVIDKCRGYEYYDMLQMKKYIQSSITLMDPFKHKQK